MRMDYRVFFPACATFGPFYMVIGLQGQGTTSGFVIADAGALMTSAALLMLFHDKTRTVTPDPPRKRRGIQLLFWCVVAVIGVLIWVVTNRAFQ